MMTSEEHDSRLQSVRLLEDAAFKAWLDAFDTARKLSAFNTWFNPSKSVRSAVEARIDKLYAESNAAYELYKKVEKVHDRLLAMPYTIRVEHPESKRSSLVIVEGFLPDFQPASKDMATAMKMLDEYYAAQRNSA